MKISIFGTGYVGLVTGACLAEVGHHVLCMDVDKPKINKLVQGVIPIFEPNLEDLVITNSKRGNLLFSSNVNDAVNFAELQFIAVGTPPDEDGSADLSHVLSVANSIGELMQGAKTVVTKSTVPVGTSDQVKQTIYKKLAERHCNFSAEVASNPEFLKEGAAVEDFMHPDRIIVGTESETTRELLRELYAPFNRDSDRLLFMDIRSAELTKYAANAMLATKISFINEIANLAEILGADIEQIRQGIGSDPRIGYQFIYPGCGYGGSCFPKDVRALEQTALENGTNLGILRAVENANNLQKGKLFSLINQYFSSDIAGKTFALWGLAFKPKTDDMREAPSRTLMEALWSANARVRAYDPEATAECARLYPGNKQLDLVNSRDEALIGADALIICTEWQNFRAPDFALLRATLKNPLIFDGRNLFDPAQMSDLGIRYYGIGRGESVEKYKLSTI